MSATTAAVSVSPPVSGLGVRRLWRGPSRDPAWARPALLGLLAVAALLYLFNLSRNGYANDFYAAAVQAGTKSWKAFFFGSFDSSNFITVDKTPASEAPASGAPASGAPASEAPWGPAPEPVMSDVMFDQSTGSTR